MGLMIWLTKKKATIGSDLTTTLSLFVTSVPDLQAIHPAVVERFPSGPSRQAMASPESRRGDVLMRLAWSRSHSVTPDAVSLCRSRNSTSLLAKMEPISSLWDEESCAIFAM